MCKNGSFFVAIRYGAYMCPSSTLLDTRAIRSIIRNVRENRRRHEKPYINILSVTNGSQLNCEGTKQLTLYSAKRAPEATKMPSMNLSSKMCRQRCRNSGLQRFRKTARRVTVSPLQKQRKHVEVGGSAKVRHCEFVTAVQAWNSRKGERAVTQCLYPFQRNES